MRLKVVVFAGASVLLGALSLRAVAGPEPTGEQKAEAAKEQAEQTLKLAGELLQPASKAIPVPDMPVVERRELEGGLVIEEMKIGDGHEVAPGASVVVYYHGTLKADGKVFDSAYERGEPISFPLGGVIEGWQKGIPGMKVGGIRRLTIPAALGYGARAAGPIPANSDLVFVVQLVDTIHTKDLTVGTGESTCASMSVAVTACRFLDAEGKELKKIEASDPYIWFPGEFEALGSGIAGMKKGGKRTIYIPKEMNQPNPQLTSDRPTGVPVTVEVELLSFRNLPGA